MPDSPPSEFDIICSSPEEGSDPETLSTPHPASTRLWECVLSGHASTAPLSKQHRAAGVLVHRVWTPSYLKVVGNDGADRMAEQGQEHPDTKHPNTQTPKTTRAGTHNHQWWVHFGLARAWPSPLREDH